MNPFHQFRIITRDAILEYGWTGMLPDSFVRLKLPSIPKKGISV
ncbi:MAG: hypothetical protein P8Y38_02325 [Deltaproteobacteria bacterium]|jgi:hypothetical protein